MTNKDDYITRMTGVGGTWAEAAFVDYAEAKGIKCDRYGFEGIANVDFWLLPAFVRSTPDYVCTYKNRAFLVECKGCGQGNRVNIKVRDINNLSRWNDEGTVYVFINDSSQDRVCMVSFTTLSDLVSHVGVTKGTWHDGVEFFAFPKSLFKWEAK